jgi:hypothetical protein
MFRRMGGVVLLLSLAVASTAACKKTPEQQEKEAAEAQRKADEKAAKAQSEADKEKAEATASLDKTRAEYKSKIQKALDDVAKRTRDVEARLTQPGAKQRPHAHDALKTVHEKSDVVRADLRHLDTATASTIENVKSKVDKDVDELKKAVDQLEKRD